MAGEIESFLEAGFFAHTSHARKLIEADSQKMQNLHQTIFHFRKSVL
jgi:hypothetical protein